MDDKQTAALRAGFEADYQKKYKRPIALYRQEDGTYGHLMMQLCWEEWQAQNALSRQRAQTTAARDVLAERARQITAEGWTPEHDDEHGNGEMAVAAGYYALACGFPHERDIGHGRLPSYWPWAPAWWKPKDKRNNLVRAGALILAEIERLDRDAAREQEKKTC